MDAMGDGARGDGARVRAVTARESARRTSVGGGRRLGAREISANARGREGED